MSRWCESIVDKFDRHWIPEPNSGCWLWLGASNENGYGLITRGKRTVKAHRFSYERANGPIATKLEIDHLCRNKCCVNPAHLEAVTHGENRRRVPRDLEFACSSCGSQIVRKHNRHAGEMRCLRCIYLKSQGNYERKNPDRSRLYYIKNRKTLLEKAKERYQKSKGG